MGGKRVYTWTKAVRIEHWWHVAAMVGLIASGFYIHMPYMAGGGETMAWMRFIHFVSMYVLIFGLIFRVYLAFNNGEHTDWKEMFPLPRNLKGIPDMLAFYLFMKDTHGDYGKYNPLQGTAYFVMGLVIIVMTCTGFALYDGWLSSSFAWVLPLLGGEHVTRIVHYLGMWVLICLTLVHLYFVIRQDMLEKDRTLMSMIDGYRETGE